MHVFRHANRQRVHHEVLLLKSGIGAHDAEAEGLGVVLHRPSALPSRRHLLSRLSALLRDGDYDVVHSHMYMFSGAVLAIAAARKVPRRIAHCHHAAVAQGAGKGAWETLRYRLLRWLIKRTATGIIGISDAAVREIAGANWESCSKSSILLYGFDFSRFHHAFDGSRALRESHHIGTNETVIGHVGRFVPEKNHRFLISVFHAVLHRLPNARLVLVGDGPLKSDIQRQVSELGIDNRVEFAGLTDEIPTYMAMFDVFVLPSTTEGLGIVALEAQAAGTPSIISAVVPAIVDVVPSLVKRLGVDAGANRWAEAILANVEEAQTERAKAVAKLEESRFGLAGCLRRLEGFYGV